MTHRVLAAIVFALPGCDVCFGQSSFQGLTPGGSTRADAERVLGPPVKEVSATLVEYAPQTVKHWLLKSMKINSGKIYVQYRQGASVVERIEVVCRSGDCKLLIGAGESLATNRGSPNPEALVFKDRGTDKEKILVFYGEPFYVVMTHDHVGVPATSTEVSLTFYSPELFEVVMPKGCNATFLGQWETSLGRMTVKKLPKNKVGGTYSKNNGTFTGWLALLRGEPTHMEELTLWAEWKDDTGAGSMRLSLHPEMTFDKRGKHTAERPATFSGKWSRTAGGGPGGGEINGRCLQ